jgi:hypothetical protein
VKKRFVPSASAVTSVFAPGHHSAEYVDGRNAEAVDLERLVVGELTERADVAARRDHEVSGRVRKLVQERDCSIALVHPEGFVVRQGARRLHAEHTPVLFVGVRDVLESPGRPQRFRHGAFLPVLALHTATVVDSTAMSYAFKLAAACIGFLLLGVLGILVFDAIWMRVGLGAAIVVVCGGLLLFAWNTDRKDRAARAEIDALPPV